MSEYDKQAIKTVESIGGFESSLDPRVLELSNDERQELHEKLSPYTTPESVEEKHPVQSIYDRERKQKKAKPKPSSSWLKKLIEFIKSILNLGGENVSYREVKRLKALLNEFTPPLYLARSERITVEFVEYIYNFYNNLNKFKLLFEELYMHKDQIDFHQPIFLLDYVESVLSDQSKLIIDKLSDSSLVELYDNDKNAKEKVDEYLRMLQDSLSKNDNDTIKSSLRPFEKILYLTSFKFEEFFQVFDPAFFDRIASSHKPEFMSLPPDKNVGLLIQEMDSYLKSIDFKTISENILYIFDRLLTFYKKIAEDMLTENNRKDFVGSMSDSHIEFTISDNEGEIFYGEDESSEPKEKKDIKTDDKRLISGAIPNKYSTLDFNSLTLTDLLHNINLLNNKKILEAMAKVCLNSINIHTKAVQAPQYLYEKYEELLTYRINSTLERIQEEIEKSKIFQKINDFFRIKQINELPKVGTYNDEFSNRLRRRHIEPFSYVTYAQLFKAFLEQIYKMSVKKTISLILIQADFIDKQRGSRFSELFYSFEQIIQDFNAFEESVSDESDEMKNIINFATGQVPEPKFRNIIQKKVYELDTSIKEIIDSAYNTLSEFNDMLYSCIRDYRSNTPEFVYNIKNVGGSANKEYMQTIIKINEDINFYISISNFFIKQHQ